jgi:hypothetical protein
MKLVCFLCFKEVSSNNQVFKHFKLFHSNCIISNYKCYVTNYQRLFDLLNSYRKHLKIHDENQFIEVQYLNFNDNKTINPQNNHKTQDDSNTDSQTNLKDENIELSIKNFKNSISNDAVQLISKWYNKSVIPRKHVELLIEDINISQTHLNILKDEVINILKLNNATCSNVSHISSMFDILEDPFKELKTEHLRLKALENLGFSLNQLKYK